MKEELSPAGMVTLVDLAEMEDGEESHKEGSVQPTATLTDQFGDSVGHICLGPC